ncbi:MAG: TetR/AcrR family transcriptional regulator [Ilumatobacteraceae bacterium]
MSPTDPATSAAARTTEVARAVARRSLERRELVAVDEVERLLQAGRDVLGNTSSARVSDIVRVAGLSNNAFYRHFGSKDELVDAIIQDGTRRLASYATHQMSKHRSPEAQVRRWINCLMDQARDPDVARQTRALLAAGRRSAGATEPRERGGVDLLAVPLHGPLRELGSIDPDRHAVYLADLTLGVLNRALARDVAPSRADVEALTRFCLAGITGTVGRSDR